MSSSAATANDTAADGNRYSPTESTSAQQNPQAIASQTIGLIARGRADAPACSRGQPPLRKYSVTSCVHSTATVHATSENTNEGRCPREPITE